MKTLSVLIMLLCAVVLTAASLDDDVQQSRFKVNGLCGMCKTRIERAMKIDGVAKAQWNKNTQILTVSYNPALITVDSLQHRLASVGHDTERYTAADSIYNALPECCHYRTGTPH
jgi:hypothetical protein